ncbi:unnamed protein product [Caenorhabditis angaria]|uniref:Uncharacterized protein n=1 Tax=Caenorhabditis angaria TaxID=860376 RepID=A0A9P1IJD5_9PELO|nr:unnamed protein product [Caenorhabditis angaria]
MNSLTFEREISKNAKNIHQKEIILNAAQIVANQLSLQIEQNQLKLDELQQKKCYLHLLGLKGNELKTAIHSTNFKEVALKEEEKGVFSFRCSCGAREGARSNTCFSKTNLSWEKIVLIISCFSKGFDNRKIKQLTKSTTYAIQNLRDALQFVDASSDFDGYIRTIATHNQSLMEQRKD